VALDVKDDQASTDVALDETPDAALDVRDGRELTDARPEVLGARDGLALTMMMKKMMN